MSASVVIVDFRNLGLNFRLFEFLSHSLKIENEPERSTHFITPTKFTLLINTNIQNVSPTCFSTTVPSSERTKCQFNKTNFYMKMCTECITLKWIRRN